MHGLGSGNRGIGVSHIRIGNEASLKHNLRLHTKECGFEENEVGKLANRDRTDFIGHSMNDRRVDGVLCKVAQNPKIIGIRMNG